MRGVKKPDPDERGRRRLFFYARIEVPGRPNIPCVVRDLTPSGATIFATRTLPPNFRLVIEAKGVNLRCQLIDQSVRSVEVAFM
jgi:hypothetical protein